MTTAIVGPVGVDMDDPFLLGTLLFATGTGTTSATQWQAINGNTLFSFTGAGFSGYQFGIPASGTVTGLSITFAGTAEFAISNFSVPLTTFYTHLASDTPAQLAAFMFGGDDSITGNSASDILIGYDGNDTITDDLGADTLHGGAGNDTLSSGANNDVLFGEAGDDNLNGGAGNDTLNGGDGVNVLIGGDGNDQLIGGSGANTLNAGDGDDTITSVSLADTVDGGTGTDTVSLDWSEASGAISATVAGGVATVTGGASVQNIEKIATLITGAGNDSVQIVGVGAIDFHGGGGADTLSLSALASGSHFDGGSGDDTLTLSGLPTASFDGGAGADHLVADFSSLVNVTMTAASINDVMSYQNIESFTIIGGSGSNDLIGGSGDDSLTGGNGADRLTGADGNDTLISGAGNDELHGGTGINTMSAGSGDDVIFASGVDTIDAGAGVDVLVLDLSASTANLLMDATGMGTDAGSVLVAGGLVRNVETLQATSGSGDDTLMLSGLIGATNFYGAGAGNDTLVLDLSSATDIVSLSFATTVSVNNGPRLDTAGVENFSITGGAFADTMTAGSGNDHLIGGAGDDALAGASGDDVLSGGAGGDNLNGGDGADTLRGGDGNDTIVGGLGADSLYGDDGNDLLFNDSGALLVDGGAGNDTLFYASSAPGSFTFTFGADHLGATQLANIENYRIEFDGGGDDVVTLTAATLVGASAYYGEGGHDTLFADLSASASAISMNGFTLTAGGASLDYGTLEEFHISGSVFADFLIGASGNDVLIGGGGNDTLYGDVDGGAGADAISGGDGDDTIYGGRNTFADTGADAIHGDAGNDTIFGQGGNDTIYGDAGDDVLIGGDGNDTILGGDGNDTITGDDSFSEGADAMDGGDGVDAISYLNAQAYVIVNLATGIGTHGAAQGDTYVSIETVLGGQGGDTLIGQNNVFNTLNGSNGNDIISGGAGADHLDGGGDNDTLDYSASSAGVNIQLASNFVLGVASGGDAEGDEIVNFENVTGSAFADVLTGAGGANNLIGGAGDDTLSGLFGADTLSGGDGNDVLIGGDGADSLAGGLGLDTASYATSSAAVTVSLQTGIGAGGDAQGDAYVSIEAITGSAFNDVLQGKDGFANVLNGGDGDDRIVSSIGADTQIGGNGVDTLDYSNSFNGVDIRLFQNTAAGGSANGDIISGFENIIGSTKTDTLAGDDGVNFIWGGAGNETVTGRDGDDHLFGDAGNDTLLGGNGDDILIGGAGNDTLGGGSGNDTADYSASGAAINVSMQTGAGSGGDAQGDTLVSIENVIGSAFDDTIAGKNNWDNVIDGGAGADTLSGGTGNDTFVFHAGQANGDTVLDFSHTGAGNHDHLEFDGYGTAVQGATFVQIDSTHWQISSADGNIHDTIVIANGVVLTSGDYIFGGG